MFFIEILPRYSKHHHAVLIDLAYLWINIVNQKMFHGTLKLHGTLSKMICKEQPHELVFI